MCTVPFSPGTIVSYKTERFSLLRKKWNKAYLNNKSDTNNSLFSGLNSTQTMFLRDAGSISANTVEKLMQKGL